MHFGGVKAVDGVSLTLAQGEILGLIGPNGAGKSTLVNAITGFQKVTSGQVTMGGVDITDWPAFRRARNGLARTFQGMRVFSELTVAENVVAAAVGVGMSPRKAGHWAREVLGRMGLLERADQRAKALPHGEERRLGVARALATRPAFVLLDEPAAGLNDYESKDFVNVLRGILTGFGCGLMVIEHDMDVIMTLCDRIQVLDYGKALRTGSPAEIRNDPAVLAAYLGTEEVSESAEA